MQNLYTEEFLKVMKVNFKIASLSANRIEEIKNFAQGIHFERLGIAHCITFSNEAQILKDYFSQYFDVYTIDCRYGKIAQKDIVGGISDRTLCNPAGQADFLNKKNTELNISVGLCVGHDMIFSKMSNALVTNLFDKNFANHHNTIQALTQIQEQKQHEVY